MRRTGRTRNSCPAIYVNTAAYLLYKNRLLNKFIVFFKRRTGAFFITPLYFQTATSIKKTNDMGNTSVMVRCTETSLINRSCVLIRDLVLVSQVMETSVSRWLVDFCYRPNLCLWYTGQCQREQDKAWNSIIWSNAFLYIFLYVCTCASFLLYMMAHFNKRIVIFIFIFLS